MADYYSAYHRALVDPQTFAVSWELVPGRGAYEEAQEAVIRSAAEAAAGGVVHCLTLTDNPGGNPAISAEMLGAEITRLGAEPLVHFTCKDKNRNQLEALLYGLERATVRNFLVMSGDYTYTGFGGRSKPVFDLDPTQLLGLITALNKGLELPAALPGARPGSRLRPANFYAGAVVNPFKALESEAMGQYYKLAKKLRAGAQFIVTQVGFDARKLHEALLVQQDLGFDQVPLVGNIYVLGSGAARLMHRGGVPGCVVTDALLARIEEEAAGRGGRDARLERAARMYALLKGMGYAGAHIGGHGLRHADVARIVERGEELAPNWRDYVAEFDLPQPNGWYYYQRDPATGLNLPEPVDRSQSRVRRSLGYMFMRLFGHQMFNNSGPLFRPMRALAEAVDGSRLEGAFTRLEHLGKVVTSECLHCGDCALPDTAYLCVTSQCPKGERNGPCGGSHEGWCEVYPGHRQCIYVRAYNRLKPYGEEDTLGAYQVPPVDYDLWLTSSWLNFFLGRDHTAKRLGVPPKAKR